MVKSSKIFIVQQSGTPSPQPSPAPAPVPGPAPVPIPQPSPSPPPPQTPPPPIPPGDKFLFAVWFPNADPVVQRDTYTPNMINRDLSRLHVNLNGSIDPNDEALLKALPGIHGINVFSLAEMSLHAPTLVSRGFEFIGYNLNFTNTPPAEYSNPGGSTAQAANIAHSNGLGLVVTIGTAMSANTTQVQQIAQNADHLHLNVRGLQNNTASYIQRVQQVASAALTIKPNIILSAEVDSTTDAAPGLTILETMQQATDGVIQFVDGMTCYFINSSTIDWQAYLAWYHNKYTPVFF